MKDINILNDWNIDKVSNLINLISNPDTDGKKIKPISLVR